MSSFTRPGLALTAALLLASSGARAAGYAVNDQGARAMGQGLAAIATLTGPESVFYNPAAIDGVAPDGWRIAFGTTLLLADFDSVPEETPDRSFQSARGSFIVPHLDAVRGLGAKWTLGLGLHAPYGLATEWAKDFPGRFLSREADLETVQLSAVVARALPHGWSVGLGPTWTTGDVTLVRDVDLSLFRNGHSAEAALTGNGSALGWRAGARWRGAAGWSFGLALHAETDLRFSGEVDYSVEELGSFSLDQAIMTLFQDGPAATTLTLPLTASVGVGHVGARWTWEVAATWTHWSVMDSVIVDLDPIEVDGQSLVVEEFVVNDWSDVVALRFGVRRIVSDKWAWAAGFYWDQSPVPVATADPLLPDSDRLSATGGLTWTSGRFTLDLAAQVVRFEGIDSKGTENPFPARWDAFVASVAVTAGWRFGAAD